MLKKILIVTILVACVFACSTNEDDVPTIADNFDRNAMLINIADNIIIPAYYDFSNKMETLKVEGELFIATPNQTNKCSTFSCISFVFWVDDVCKYYPLLGKRLDRKVIFRAKLSFFLLWI